MSLIEIALWIVVALELVIGAVLIVRAYQETDGKE